MSLTIQELRQMMEEFNAMDSTLQELNAAMQRRIADRVLDKGTKAHNEGYTFLQFKTLVADRTGSTHRVYELRAYSKGLDLLFMAGEGSKRYELEPSFVCLDFLYHIYRALIK